MWHYTGKVLEHFVNPRNVGELENPDGVGEVGSIACGDALRLAFKLDDKGKIEDVKFLTFGCASAIASASALTEMLKGKTVEEAEKIGNQDIAEYLGGLPEEKMHCSVMGREALEAAIANYRGREFELKEAQGELVCTCFGVTEGEIERAIRENGLSTVEQVTHYTKAGGGCGKCHDRIQEIIDRVVGKPPEEGRPKKVQKKPLTNIQKIKLIEETMNTEVRPLLRADGGDVELVDVEGDGVIVQMRGTCAKCPSSPVTAKELVEKKLREFVSDSIYVKEVRP